MEHTATEVSEIRKILTKQHEQLVHHISRSDTLQENQDHFKQALTDIVSRLEPLEQQKTMADFIEEYEKNKKDRLITKLKDWKVVVTFITGLIALGAGIGKMNGWF